MNQLRIAISNDNTLEKQIELFLVKYSQVHKHRVFNIAKRSSAYGTFALSKLKENKIHLENIKY